MHWHDLIPCVFTKQQRIGSRILAAQVCLGAHAQVYPQACDRWLPHAMAIMLEHVAVGRILWIVLGNMHGNMDTSSALLGN